MSDSVPMPTAIDRKVDAAIDSIPDGNVRIRQYTEMLGALLGQQLPIETDVDTAKCYCMALTYVAASVVAGAIIHAGLPVEYAKLMGESFREQLCDDEARANIEGALLAAAPTADPLPPT